MVGRDECAQGCAMVRPIEKSVCNSLLHSQVSRETQLLEFSVIACC